MVAVLLLVVVVRVEPAVLILNILKIIRRRTIKEDFQRKAGLHLSINVGITKA